MYPSVHTMQVRLGINLHQAKQVRGLMEKSTSVEQCLREIDKILGGFGVEVINGNAYVSPYWNHARIVYVNMGDTYSPTVLYDTETEKFYVSPWGDYVEILERSSLWRSE